MLPQEPDLDNSENRGGYHMLLTKCDLLGRSTQWLHSRLKSPTI